jgi:hypothetical protein
MQDNDRLINYLRGVHFVFGVLNNQQDDPLCGNCLSFARTVEAAKEKFLSGEKTILKDDLPDEMRALFLDIYNMHTDIRIPDNPIGQKKAGSCKLPEGVCFSKAAMTVYEKISG